MSNDYEQIRNVLAKVAYGGDLGEPALAADGYTADGTFAISGFPANIADDSETSGRQALTAMYSGLFDANQGNVRHWIGNTWFVDEPARGHDVEVRSYFALFRVGIVPAPGIVMTGTYVDTFVHEDDAWRIQRRDCVVDPHPRHRGTAPSDILLAELDRTTEQLRRIGDNERAHA